VHFTRQALQDGDFTSYRHGWILSPTCIGMVIDLEKLNITKIYVDTHGFTPE
jgi:hypothetical protein